MAVAPQRRANLGNGGSTTDAVLHLIDDQCVSAPSCFAFKCGILHLGDIDYNCSHLSTECSQKSLNKSIERATSAPAGVALRQHERTACCNAVVAKVSDHAARSTDADGNAELRFSMCRRGSAFCVVAKPYGLRLSVLGIRQHHRSCGHSFTDAGVHFASASLVGYRRHTTATPSRRDMESRADHRTRSLHRSSLWSSERQLWVSRVLFRA